MVVVMDGQYLICLGMGHCTLYSHQIKLLHQVSLSFYFFGASSFSLHLETSEIASKTSVLKELKLHIADISYWKINVECQSFTHANRIFKFQHAKHSFDPSLCVCWIFFLLFFSFTQSAALFIFLLGRLHLGGQPITEIMFSKVKDMSG